MHKLNPGQAAIFCLAIIKASRQAMESGGLAIVPLMVSEPGCGKSSIAKQIASKMGYDSLIVITPTMHSTLDLRGLPYVEDGQTKFAASTILPASGKHLILIDELGDCPIHEQSGFYQLLLDRRLGEYSLPVDCDIVAATNDETHGACANPLSTAVKTRVAICHVVSELEQSVKYAIATGWHPRVIGFMRACPQSLAGFNQEDFAAGSTGRGLQQLSQLEKSGVPDNDTIKAALFQGLIGEDIGTRYETFRNLKIPDISKVFSSPENAEIPDESAKLFALSAMIVFAAASNKNFAPVFRYAGRLDRVSRIGLVTDLVRACGDSAKGADYAKFIVQNGDLIL